MQFMFRRIMSNSKGVDKNILRSSFVPHSYHPSVAAISELKKALISDLTLETHHRGSYILVRAVTPTDVMTAIMAVVEDQRGDVLMLQLYNQEADLATDGRLVEGTVILIKEPYLKMMADGDYGLRVDHLSDIMLIPEHDTLVPSVWRTQSQNPTSAIYWKTKGNNFFNKSAYYDAIGWYDMI